jgi:Questin oxidase-like
VGHPLIHLGYAFELSSRDIAMEALGLASTQYNYFHKYLDDPATTKASPFSSTSPLELLEKAYNDERFDKLFEGDKSPSMEELFRHHKPLMLEYWNAWAIKQPRKQFEDSQHLAMLLLAGTQPVDSNSFSFFLVHTLTTSHAVRICLPFIPPQFEVPLVRQWWLFILGVYISQGRPKIQEENVSEYDAEGDNWNALVERATSGKWSLDAHYVKAVRALKEAASTWGDEQQLYFKAAAKFAKQFDGWFGSTEEHC